MTLFPVLSECIVYIPILAERSELSSWPTIWNGHACNDNCNQTWHVRTRVDRRCLLFPLWILAILLLWASCKGQGSSEEKRPLRIPNRKNQIIATPLWAVSSLMQWQFFWLPAIITACSFLVVFLVVKGGEKQAGSATTHSSVSCLQSAPLTH